MDGPVETAKLLTRITTLLREREEGIKFAIGLQLKLTDRDTEIRHLKYQVASGHEYVLLLEEELANHRIQIEQLEKYQLDLQTELKNRLGHIEELQNYVRNLETALAPSQKATPNPSEGANSGSDI